MRAVFNHARTEAAEGNEDGTSQAGLRPGPSSYSIIIRKAGPGWHSVTAAIYGKLGIQKHESKVFPTFPMNEKKRKDKNGKQGVKEGASIQILQTIKA